MKLIQNRRATLSDPEEVKFRLCGLPRKFRDRLLAACASDAQRELLRVTSQRCNVSDRNCEAVTKGVLRGRALASAGLRSAALPGVFTIGGKPAI
jgi:hypothetical protein